EVLSYYVHNYKKGEIRKELLRDHIKKALSYAEGVEDSRVGVYASRQLGINNFKELLEYAIIFHDIGKVFFQTEANLRQGQDSTYLSFKGHEFISALLTDLFSSKKHHNMYYIAVTFSVFYHHHAMNPEARKKITLPNISDENQLYRDKIFSVLSDFLNVNDREVLSKCIDTFMKMLHSRNLINYLHNLQSKIYDSILLSTMSHSIRKVSFLLLDCLIACDYMAAQDRESGGSIFFQTISEFYNIWMKG
ncbi:MAG TPA: CRISPR-associated endonuclease Cas3'', partial [Candidatus Caldiarchaeum subterraneum]|nr:CRISPR-associated endonuclease Cas3'' [Candidatus Caldarchaeum subterraneum]